MAPAQAALWPTPLLAQWPLEVAAALAAWTVAWCALVGAFLARGVAHETPLARTVAMGAILTLVGGVPGAAMALGVNPLEDLGGVLSWASPFTGVVSLTSGPANLRLDVTRAQWTAIGSVGSRLRNPADLARLSASLKVSSTRRLASPARC